MVLGSLINGFGKRNSSTPNLNELTRGNTYSSDVVSYYNYKKVYMNYYKTVPELNAFVNMIATDINEEFDFRPLKKDASGRNKILSARKFAKLVNLSRTNFSCFVDSLVTGESYGWIGKVSKADVENVITEKLKERGIVDNLSLKALAMSVVDEEALKVKKYRYIASTTVENKFNDVEITEYVQRVGNDRVVNFKPSEVIHFKFYDVDGRVAGFSCVGAIITQLELLKFMWQNQLAVARNGGHMDKIISIEDIDVSSAAYKKIEGEIRKFNSNTMSRHGIMLLNGKAKVTELTQLDSMQFKDMGLYITGTMAMEWSVPRSRLPIVIGGTNTQADTGGNSEIGYWKNISSFRRSYCDTFNQQFWIPYFGVEMYFKDTYNHQDLLEQQKFQTELNNVRFMNEELAKSGKRLSDDYLMDKFGISDDDVTDFDPMDNPMVAMEQENLESESQFRQGLAKNKDLKKGSDGKKVSDKKKSEQNSRSKQPSGYGKEFSFKEKKTVDLATFLNLYDDYSDVVVNDYNSGVVKLVYEGSDFVYECFAKDVDVPSSLINKN